jgi:hypothetical protein
MYILYLIAVFFIAVCILLVLKTETSKNRTSKVVKPGETYSVGKRHYKIPDLPVKGHAYILDEEFITRMRTLYTRINSVFEELNMDFWVSGGTLLGFIRHKTFLPWDDDLDIHTDSKNKAFLHSDEFRNALNKHGMDSLFMMGSNETFSYYKGGVRVKMLEHLNPVMDIFFVHQEQGRMIKVENWMNNNMIFNKKENWKYEDIYPIKQENIDDLPIKLPSNPNNVLTAQYGDSYDKEIHCGHPPHTIAYDMLRFIWKNKA